MESNISVLWNEHKLLKHACEEWIRLLTATGNWIPLFQSKNYLCQSKPTWSLEFFRSISAFKEPNSTVMAWGSWEKLLGKPAGAGGQVVPSRHLARSRGAHWGGSVSSRRWKNRNYNSHEEGKIGLTQGVWNQMSAQNLLRNSTERTLNYLSTGHLLCGKQRRKNSGFSKPHPQGQRGFCQRTLPHLPVC